MRSANRLTGLAAIRLAKNTDNLFRAMRLAFHEYPSIGSKKYSHCKCGNYRRSRQSRISEGDEGLESLPHPEECGETLTSSEMGPIAEGVSCGSSDSVGNQLNRTVCNLAPYNSNAISMPEGRAADCFRIAALKGNNITFEIVKESDGSVIFDTSMGTTAFDRLVLIGEPGDTVYRINLTGADEADASVTLEFIDHPMF
jgi:hypothetical protein